jgi:hypothetical protein
VTSLLVKERTASSQPTATKATSTMSVENESERAMT